MEVDNNENISTVYRMRKRINQTKIIPPKKKVTD